MGLLISLIGAAVTVGGLCISFGVLKSKIAENSKMNDAQVKQIEQCATRLELAEAIKRSDEKLALAIKHSDDMLELMRKRAEEDRAAGEGRYKELYGIITVHGERIGKLEVSQEQLFKMLDKLEATVTNGFQEMKVDMKELRNTLNRARDGERRQAT
jgi:hypothetical protein